MTHLHHRRRYKSRMVTNLTIYIQVLLVYILLCIDLVDRIREHYSHMVAVHILLCIYLVDLSFTKINIIHHALKDCGLDVQHTNHWIITLGRFKNIEQDRALG